MVGGVLVGMGERKEGKGINGKIKMKKKQEKGEGVGELSLQSSRKVGMKEEG